MIKGHCQCKSISYQVKSTPFNCCYCHCSICRRLTGSAVGAYGTVPNSDFEWLSGRSFLSSYDQNDRLRRFFCSRCGSPLVSKHELDPENTYLSLGCLNTSEDLSIKYQQFVASKANWSSMDTKIEAHEAWPKWVLDKVKNKNSIED